MDNLQVQRILRRLYRIAEAGEKGYATAAVNMPNPGIKVIMKAYARQRAEYKKELEEALRQHSGDLQAGHSIPGIIHRGRVAIFAGMAIERERQVRVVLKEALTGESYALRAYAKALGEDLPGTLRNLLERQQNGVQQAAEEMRKLLGLEGTRTVVGSFASEISAAQAAQKLQRAGFAPETIQTRVLEESDLYHEPGATVLETTASGAFGGALWGGLTGILVGFGAAQATHPAGAPFSNLLLTWLLAWLGFMGVGILIGAVLAVFIGSSISEGDRYDYKDTVRRGSVLVSVAADEARAAEAAGILKREPPPENHTGVKPVASGN